MPSLHPDAPGSPGFLASLARTADPGDWVALFDPERRCVHLQRGQLGEIPERLLGVEYGAPHELAGEVLVTGVDRDAQRIFDDPRLGPRTFEYRLRPLHGERGVMAVIASCSEATVRRATQQAVRVQSQVLEAIQDGVLLLDEDGAVTLFNPAAQALLAVGGDRGFPLGRPLADLNRHLAAACAKPGIVVVDVPRQESRGAEALLLECRTQALRIDGRARRLVMLRDVSARGALEREVAAVETRERERIARDLHDGVGQELTGAAMLLRHARSRLRDDHEAVAAELDQVTDILNSVVADMRELARGLFARVSAERDLCAALRALAERAAARSGIAVRFAQPGAPVPLLPEAAHEALYRVAQEATTNAMRHSGARNILLSLQLAADGTLTLAVEDDGRGYVSEPGRGEGLGLRIMRARAQQLGAQLTIGPGRDGGTRVACAMAWPPAVS